MTSRSILVGQDHSKSAMGLNRLIPDRRRRRSRIVGKSWQFSKLPADPGMESMGAYARVQYACDHYLRGYRLAGGGPRRLWNARSAGSCVGDAGLENRQLL